LVEEANFFVADLFSHTKFDSVPLFDIFPHRKCNEVVQHDHTQTAVAHDWLNQTSWNKYGHAARSLPMRRYTSTRCYVTNSYI